MQEFSIAESPKMLISQMPLRMNVWLFRFHCAKINVYSCPLLDENFGINVHVLPLDEIMRHYCLLH